MAYDPDEHARLESLYLKYGARLQSAARSVREHGRRQLAGHDLSEAYEDALATAHAVYAYLLAHPVRRIAPSSVLPDDSVEVVAH
jgi:hypothetical protein